MIPGLANVAAATMSAAWEAGESGKQEVADRHLVEIAPLASILKLAKAGGLTASLVSGLKSALKMMGIIDHDTVTKPLRPLSEEEKEKIPPLLHKSGLLDPVSG